MGNNDNQGPSWGKILRIIIGSILLICALGPLGIIAIIIILAISHYYNNR